MKNLRRLKIQLHKARSFIYKNSFPADCLKNDSVIDSDIAIDFIYTLIKYYESSIDLTCRECKHSRDTNLKDEISHGELFCTEMARFFNKDFKCNKWEKK